MDGDEVNNDFKWIHPETVLIDYKLFTLYFRHIGFFDERNIIISYSKFQNKCSYDLRVKKSAQVINGIETKLNPKARENNLKYPGNSNKGLPFIFDVSDEQVMYCKVELNIYKDQPRKFLVKVIIKIEYYFKNRNYRIVEANVIEIN